MIVVHDGGKQKYLLFRNRLQNSRFIAKVWSEGSTHSRDSYNPRTLVALSVLHYSAAATSTCMAASFQSGKALSDRI